MSKKASNELATVLGLIHIDWKGETDHIIKSWHNFKLILIFNAIMSLLKNKTKGHMRKGKKGQKKKGFYHCLRVENSSTIKVGHHWYFKTVFKKFKILFLIFTLN